MQAVLARGKSFRFRALGWSMLPFVQDGDVISVSPFRDSQPGVGDVVAFMSPQTHRPIVHRVIARQGERYLIQGDNLSGISDGFIPRDDIIGRITRIERGGRDVNIGLGPERRMIALLSRHGLLGPVLRRASRLFHLVAGS